jgi:formylglycine-generating enzyme required for sulfatase activity
LDGEPTFAGWRFDFPWEVVAGDFVVEMLLEQRLLARRVFHVKPLAFVPKPPSCHLEPEGVGSTAGPGPSAPVFALMKQDGCMGTCPRYRVAVHRDGTIDYFGQAYVDVSGARTSTISRESTKSLMQLFDDVDFLSLQDHYPQIATDGPTFSVAFSCDGHQKTVAHGYPAPTAALFVEQRLDELARIDTLVGNKEKQANIDRDDPQSRGDSARDRDPIDAVIRERITPAAQRCYEEGPRSEPSDGGHLWLSAEVTLAGDVASATVERNSGLSPEVVACITSVVRNSTFDSIVAYESTIRVPIAVGASSSGAAAAPRISCPRDMTAVPGGPFTMGATSDAHGPREEVTVGGFCLDRLEVTVSAYDACVKGGACTEPGGWAPDVAHAACNWRRPKFIGHPVNCVEGKQATAYCKWLGKRLPTEAEWEWAAQGGSEGRSYPWGEDPPSPALLNGCGIECLAWFQRNDPPTASGGPWRHSATYELQDGWPTTAPVGLFPKGANRWGALDLAGNVAEWTSRVGEVPRWGEQLVASGSSWRGPNPTIAPDARSDVGLRCAR